MCEWVVKLPRLDLTGELALLLTAAMCGYGGPEAQDGEDDWLGGQQGERLDQRCKEGIPQTLLKSGTCEDKQTVGPKPRPISNTTWIPAWDHTVRL